MNRLLAWSLVSLGMCAATATASEHRQVSGIYPHLAYFNDENECGTGAVVPWADRLWVITYAPHKPEGSTDKLYEIDSDLNQIVRPESVGGTPANRMIHQESNQLIIGPYVIDGQGQVRVIPPSRMFGRLTGNARHLTDPAHKVYYATMEEGFYEVNLETLEVTELYADNQRQITTQGQVTEGTRQARLPGYHGKGLYSGQGRLVYANNGEATAEARQRPDVASGCLAEWDGRQWRVVRRNQFTEVTGPGGLYGNVNPETDPIWSIGWDHRSVLLMVLDEGEWHCYRLPKGSHAYDGAHGWNTEWPRIRDIGRDNLLMTMHGLFWSFPRALRPESAAGLRPRSAYLKVIGDFCHWKGRLVFGCDDTARSEFLNKSRAKGTLEPPGQSHSNLWFVEPERIDALGVPLGRGAVWLEESVEANQPSDAFLFSGFEHRSLHLTHATAAEVIFTVEVDREGTGAWQPLRQIEVKPRGYQWVSFGPKEPGAWVRLRAGRQCQGVTAYFQYSNEARRGRGAPDLFQGLATVRDPDVSGGLVRVRGNNLRTLSFAPDLAKDGAVREAGYYELDADLKLRRVEDPTTRQWLLSKAAIPQGIVTVDEASVLYVDDEGNRWRLPKGDLAFDEGGPLGVERLDREVVTERDLFNCHGTFYELPARNAGGFAKIRPIATHNRRIKDYCSYRGLLVLSGVTQDAAASEHIIRSEDGQVALWVGVVDDLWQLGKPRGQGGPWNESEVEAHQPSDPYLLTGYDRKSMMLSHQASREVEIRIEVDLTGTGVWRTWKAYRVPASETVRDDFPVGFQAYWLRAVADQDCRATVMLRYE